MNKITRNLKKQLLKYETTTAGAKFTAFAQQDSAAFLQNNKKVK